MNITVAYYYFHQNNVAFKTFKVDKETHKCYFANGRRYSKDEIGMPIIKYISSYPYIELIMVDASEETLRDGLSKWFSDKAYQVWKIKN